MDEILRSVRAFDGVTELAPVAGDAAPEIAWGDHFFYYAPDGRIPRHQPFATVVTKDYPGDTGSRLDAPDRRRLNIHVGGSGFIELLGQDPKAELTGWDFGAVDVILPHPLYSRQGWVAIVNPAAETTGTAMTLVRRAYETACAHAARRAPGSN